MRQAAGIGGVTTAWNLEPSSFIAIFAHLRSRANPFHPTVIKPLAVPANRAPFPTGATRMGQLTASAFQAYDPNNVGSITAGPFALYSVSVDSLLPTQMNEGFAEV